MNLNTSLNPVATMRLWAVRESAVVSASTPHYTVEAPETWTKVYREPFPIAFATTQNDALAIAAALNSAGTMTSVVELPEDSRKNNRRFDYAPPSGPKLQGTVVAYAKNEEDARWITETLNDADRASCEPACEPMYNQKGGVLHNYDFIQVHVKKLAGRILTILDAAFVNDQQNRAIKRLVKDEISQKLSEIWVQSFTSAGDCKGGDSSDRELESVLD